MAPNSQLGNLKRGQPVSTSEQSQLETRLLKTSNAPRTAISSIVSTTFPFGSGLSCDPLPPSPPAEKASACQDQAGQASAGDGSRHRRWIEQGHLDEPANVTLGKRWVWTALKHKHLGDLE